MTSKSSGNSHQQQGLTLKHTLRFQWFQVHVAASQKEEAIELTRAWVVGVGFKARAQHSALKGCGWSCQYASIHRGTGSTQFPDFVFAL